MSDLAILVFSNASNTDCGVSMTDKPKKDDSQDDKRKMDDVLKKMLKKPPNPVKGKDEKPKGKG